MNRLEEIQAFLYNLGTRLATKAKEEFDKAPGVLEMIIELRAMGIETILVNDVTVNLIVQPNFVVPKADVPVHESKLDELLTDADRAFLRGLKI